MLINVNLWISILIAAVFVCDTQLASAQYARRPIRRRVVAGGRPNNVNVNVGVGGFGRAAEAAATVATAAIAAASGK